MRAYALWAEIQKTLGNIVHLGEDVDRLTEQVDEGLNELKEIAFNRHDTELLKAMVEIEKERAREGEEIADMYEALYEETRGAQTALERDLIEDLRVARDVMVQSEARIQYKKVV
jgi:hypothetical protein